MILMEVLFLMKHKENLLIEIGLIKNDFLYQNMIVIMRYLVVGLYMDYLQDLAYVKIKN
jgi:hypothetical protein